MSIVQHPLPQICDPNAKPSIVRETASTALIEGNNSLGAVVGNFAMGVAIEKARSTGVGWVTARGSNHFGIAGHYSAQALSQNMLGMAFTNGGSTISSEPQATASEHQGCIITKAFCGFSARFSAFIRVYL